jgi:hypothetical protein
MLELSIVIGDDDVNGSESPPSVVVNGSDCVPPVPGRAIAKHPDSSVIRNVVLPAIWAARISSRPGASTWT